MDTNPQNLLPLELVTFGGEPHPPKPITVCDHGTSFSTESLSAWFNVALSSFCLIFNSIRAKRVYETVPSPNTSQKETSFGSKAALCDLKLCVSQGEDNGKTPREDASGSCEESTGLPPSDGQGPGLGV